MTKDFGWCTLKVTNDNMHALVCISENTSEEEPTFSEQMVLDALASVHIVNGISHIAIQSLIENMMYGQYLCVAKGTLPTKGNDGYFSYHKEVQDMKRKPLINEDGTADYKNSLSLAVIKQGEMLATYIPPTKGTSGLDIFGNTVPALGNGKDQPPLRGKGITHDEEKVHYYAEISGHIVMDKDKISIEKLYRVNGDLDLEVGNIRFDGDVEVCGDVRSGMTIEATGDIFVRGHVGGCKLTSKQNIIIDKGIQGRETCEITAMGDIVCKFVESCTLNSQQNIYADSILNSHVIAKNQVLVKSKNGNVIGGDIYGMSGVIVKSAGNEIGTPTLLRAGLPREAYIRVNELKALIKKNEEKTEAFNQHLSTITETEIKTQIMRAKIVLDSQINEYSDELEELEARIATDYEGSFVQITDVVHNDVKIQISEYQYIVHEAIKDIIYRVVGSEIMGSGSDDISTTN